MGKFTSNKAYALQKSMKLAREGWLGHWAHNITDPLPYTRGTANYGRPKAGGAHARGGSVIPGGSIFPAVMSNCCSIGHIVTAGKNNIFTSTFCQARPGFSRESLAENKHHCHSLTAPAQKKNAR